MSVNIDVVLIIDVETIAEIFFMRKNIHEIFRISI